MRAKFLLLCMLVLGCVQAWAIKVDGKLLDENKEPVIGATVTVKGTKNSVASDLDGNFTIQVDRVKEDALIVSSIGYKKRVVALKGRTILTIELESESNELNEIVVVGYGSMKKSDLTGSVTSIKTTEAESARATSFDRMIQGKAAGVVVSTGSAAPGGSVSVKIRGTSSLRGNNSPLYVIDGTIISDLGDTTDPMAQGTGSGNSSAPEQNPLAAINPQDIENIEILKDASATAIYGSQGANGVVLITTKKGKSGKTAINVSVNTTISTLKSEIPMLDSYEYLDFYNSFIGDGGIKLTMDGYTPVNWQRFATRTAVSQNYRASISGKSNKTTYFVATGYNDQEGIIKNSNVKKADIRVNLSQDITDRISLSSNTFFSAIQTSMTSGTDKLANTRSSIVRHMISYKPLTGIDSDPDQFDEELTGPDAWFSDYDDNSEDNMFNTNLTLDVKALDWLTVRLKGGMVYRNKERSMWYGTALYNGAACNGKAGISTMKSKSYDVEALLIANKKINVHSINGTLGVVYNKKHITQTSQTGENFFSKDLRADGISQAGTLYPFQYAKVGEQLFSVLARGVYSYDNRYVLTATFRADGSSKFNKKNRFSYFPSFAFAWRAKEETFLKDIDIISNLKVRAGWGMVGNQAISPYQTLATYGNGVYTKVDGSSDPALQPSRIPNPNLKWETSEQYNVGVDFGMFGQRLTLIVDAYIKNTKDLLQEIAIPYSTGFKSMWVNNGKIQNKGIEFAVEGVALDRNDWRWTIGANIAFSKNTIKELGMAPADFGMLHGERGYFGENVGNNTYTKFPANVFLVNYPVGLFMGYQTNGIMQEEYYNSEENQKNPLTMNGSQIKPGDVLYVDQHKDGVINDKDRVVIGDPNPDFVYALNTAVSYKNWTLDMAFNGVYGNDIINANLIDETDVKNAQKNVRRDSYYYAWTAENKSNLYPRLGYTPQGVLSDRFVEDGSYLKLSNITLSYNLKFKKTKWINNMTFSFTASNVFTITNYSGYDPDVNTFANDVDRMGIDLTSYPSARSYTLGVIANF